MWQLQEYFHHMLDKAEGTAEADTNISEDFRAYYLKKQHSSGEKDMDKWKYLTDAYHEANDTLERVWKFSSGVCLGLEILGAHMTRKQEGVDQYEWGKCTVGKTGRGARGSSFQPECSNPLGAYHWKGLNHKIQLNNNNKRDRTFMACKELVTMLMGYFQMTSSMRRTAQEIKARNPCSKFYKLLKKWGGEGIAQQIMKTWFLEQSQRTGQQSYQLLEGKDVYEVISEFLYGEDAGDKEIYCKQSTTRIEATQEEQVDYETEVAGTEQIGQCKDEQASCLQEMAKVLESIGEELEKERPDTGSRGSETTNNPKQDESSASEGGSDGSGLIAQLLGAGVGVLMALLGAYGYYRIFYSGKKVKPIGNRKKRFHISLA
ncbi:hypothetical protein C922_05626 [Plasmodium inui San Antonio 1]|uniref:Uncharacterized protein n=1 Tax=Plasmodium inui San Antonio 1 TaxID=1237626 RepID=W6ZXK4_9APIC|nr:hypothetical protein C922_05626 [Plasmodium inui San Antonio 1]EUD63995.1 hypothetical protein C922_05626 [Plasmodium inui San Antonio 1]